MHPNQHPCIRQSLSNMKRVSHYAGNADSYAMFNLLTYPQLFDCIENLLPDHGERLIPPTETLCMLLSQAMSADVSCQQVVNDTMIKSKP